MYPGTHAAVHPERSAVIVSGSGATVSYRELEDRSCRLAQLLHAHGIRTGDRIALLAENHPRYFEVYWAAIRSGLYITAVNWHLTAADVAYLITDCGAKALVATAALAHIAEPLLPSIPDCTLRLMIDGTVAGFASYESAIARYPDEPLVDQPRGEVMLYSSGTTGRPKGVMRPLAGKQIDDPTNPTLAMLERMLLEVEEGSVYLCPAPMYHAAALQWSTAVHEIGGTVVIMERFDPTEWLQVIEEHLVTHTQVVPTMLVRVMKLPTDVRLRFDIGSLRCVVHAAAPCPVELKRQVIAWLGPIVSEYYGAHLLRRKRDHLHLDGRVAGAPGISWSSDSRHPSHLR